MSTTNIPDPMDLVRAKVRWATRYVEIGWKVFVLGRDKTPLPNCAECRDADWSHDRDKCQHLTCHGFYAATNNLYDIEIMVRYHPDGWLAVRTGAASRLLVLDFEAAPNAEGVTGLDTLDQWEMWTGIELPPASTLRQRTQSGGLHLMFRLPPGIVVRSRNRILPQCDVKAEGGYVAVPTPGRPEREWLRPSTGPGDQHDDIREAPRELLDALDKLRGSARAASGTGGSAVNPHTAGYDFNTYLLHGCPGGARDTFFNELLFRGRKAGWTRDVIERNARLAWELCEQPPATEWYMPWEHVAYKIERVWRTVEPTMLPSWRPTLGVVQDDGTVKIGNVTLAREPRGGGK